MCVPNYVILTVVAIVFGVAFYVQDKSDRTGAAQAHCELNLERWATYAGLILGLGLSIKNGLKGSAGIYIGGESDWNALSMMIMGPLMIVSFAAVSVWVLRRQRNDGEAPFPRAYAIVWLVLLVQNVLAQLVTGPPTRWAETVYSIYYVLLFSLSSVIVCHYQFVKMRHRDAAEPAPQDAH